MKKITVERRSSLMHASFHAEFNFKTKTKGKPKTMIVGGSGATYKEALGDLLERHASSLGIEIKDNFE